MPRALIALCALAAYPLAAYADGQLAGAPAPEVQRSAIAGCESRTWTETAHGVRVQRSTRAACTQTAQAPAVSEAAPTSVNVTVTTNLNTVSRRYGASPYVVGSPRWMRAKRRNASYVLGSPHR